MKLRGQVNVGRGSNSTATAKAALSKSITEKRRLHKEKQTLVLELDERRDQFRKLVEENKKIRPKLRNFKEDQINTDIKIVQKKIETTSVSLQEEKKLLQELKDLEASKPLAQ